ncbi:hypothetical protein BD324DRAFT_668370 [Kockovaella imperatae]|uniref:Uncharacterized protein n=1 Tax=Kockovaella imperatae TaxID=4999 RepID=A0A1Y1UQG4_9TREE|nr:hypothetical protein BD324DRAFT_668370 [Kockovaella imperatae]ORX40281.1 hypothetical protein BD324DRAFT_668370 [Kockovaella imperatae]
MSGQDTSTESGSKANSARSSQRQDTECPIDSGDEDVKDDEADDDASIKAISRSRTNKFPFETDEEDDGNVSDESVSSTRGIRRRYTGWGESQDPANETEEVHYAESDDEQAKITKTQLATEVQATEKSASDEVSTV